MAELSRSNTELIYQAVMEKIKADNAISTAAVNLWFENCKIKDIDSESVFLTVENEMKKKSILTHYSELLSKYFSFQLGYMPKIVIDIDRDFVPKPLGKEDNSEEAYMEDSGYYNDDDDYNKKEILFTKNNDYTFENYVVGSSNTFAYSAARSIAEKPSNEFNPFFIYGPSGIGKTHLLYAIANKILEKYPSKVILYVKSEEFTNALIESLKEGTMNLFRQKYRNVDVLLVDDIQFIAGKKSPQEEFFNTFNTLFENHKQIILSSDRSPSEMATLEDRLRTRFKSGLIQDIQPPDFELRLAILRKKSENAGLPLSDEILEFLADKLHSNIREIEGVIKKLSALSFLNGIDINMNTVRENVADFLRDEEPAKMVVSRVISETAKRFDVSVEEILGRKRDKQIQSARNVSMYIIRMITQLSLPEIGVMFERKHSSVKSNIDTVRKNLETDVFLEKQIDDIIKAVKA